MRPNPPYTHPLHHPPSHHFPLPLPLTSLPSHQSSHQAVPSVQLSPLIDTNMAPVILANGSVFGLWRNDDDRGSVHVVLATDWKNPHTYVEYGSQTGQVIA